MDKLWYISEIKDRFRFLYKKITGNQLVSFEYAGQHVLNEDGGSEMLINAIQSGKPFMASRYGYVELETMAAVYEFDNTGKLDSIRRVIEKGDIFNNAGFFPKSEDLVVEFGHLMLQESSMADLMGVWYIPKEEYFVHKLSPQTKLCRLRTFEPWNENIPWTIALKGKKVVVVHPFNESIQSQYAVRKKLFTDERILPDFELRIVKAVQTIAGNKDTRFANWFEALEYMYDEIMKEDFDVAILGCGSYGLPLAARIKSAGKQVVHIGGATQLLFGIKGKRWDNHPVVSKLYNDNWVRPSTSEIPEGKSKVENGCYW